MSGGQRFYNEEEAEQLLRIASRQVDGSSVSRDELIRAAGELGITPAALEEAERELAQRTALSQQEQETNRLKAEFNAWHKRKFFTSIGEYLSTAVIVTAIWFATGRGYFWPQWVFFGFGLGLFDNFSKTFLDPARKHKAFEKWMAKRRAEGRTPELGFDPTEDH